MTTQPLPPADPPSITLGQVTAHAGQLGITADMLTSYRKAALLASPTGGRRSPARALAQLDAIAAAHGWTRSHDLIRHAMWWSGVPIEDFGRLQERWAGHLYELAQLGQYVRSLPDEARDVEARGLAEFLSNDRRFPFPRQHITSLADRQSFAALMVGLVAGDLQTVVFDEEVVDVARADTDGTLLLQAIRKGLRSPVDDDRRDTLGDLMSAGFRADSLADAGVWMALFACHWVPDPEQMCGVMAAISEERAGQVRDFIKRWVSEVRFGIDLERLPEVASMLLVVFDRMTAELPELLLVDAV